MQSRLARTPKIGTTMCFTPWKVWCIRKATIATKLVIM